LPMFRGILGERSRDLKSMNVAEVQKIHPMLLTAEMSKEAGLMVATMDADKWALLSTEQRKVVANKFVSVANMRGLRSVMVYVNEVMIIDVSGGALRYLQ
jgi:hypothetical protein